MYRTAEMLLSEETNLLLNSLYRNTPGYLHLSTGKNRKGIYPSTSAFLSSLKQDILNNKKINYHNRRMSLATFRKKGTAEADNLLSQCALAINLLPKDGGSPQKLWNSFYRACMEYHQEYLIPYMVIFSCTMVHLVYAFEQPVCLQIKDRVKKERTISWLEKLRDALAERIDLIVGEAEVIPVKLNGSVSVPGAAAITYTGYMDYERGTFRYTVDRQKICLGYHPERGKKWDVHALSYLLLSSSQKENAGNKKKKNYMPMKEILKNRVQFLYQLQQKEWVKTEREKLTFLFWNFVRQMGLCEDVAKMQAEAFIKRFPGENMDLLSLARPAKNYKYTTEALLKTLGMTREEAISCGLYISDKKAYDREYSRRRRKTARDGRIQSGVTKKQLMEKAAKKVQRFRRAGRKLKEIARSLRISLSTVKNYLKLQAAAPALG